MPEVMKKNEFMKKIRSARDALEKLLFEFNREQMDVSAEEKNWTVKDVIAHIGWYEAEMVNVLRQHALEGSDLWDLPLNERNAAIFTSARNDDLASIVEKEAQIYQTMLELLEEVNESDLNDSLAFKGMPADWQPWSVIASNTYEHYQDHIDQLKKLLKKQAD
jgi:hypothetical protein